MKDDRASFTGARRPGRVSLTGRLVRLDPLFAQHAAALWSEIAGADLWTFMTYGPFTTQAHLGGALTGFAASDDPLFFTIIEQESERALGWLALMAIRPEHGVIEIGNVLFAPALQRTPMATEAVFLALRHCFDLGYRRVEWKCDAANARSRQAAMRFGFTHEGTFRQHMMVKGRNRDTAWFALLDRDWPARRDAFERWLDASNFDAAGRQREPLARSADS